jgi:putative ABC transport system substrate-binding protein
MKRRDFVAGLGSAAVWPLAARAQQPERVQRIGVLSGYATDDIEGNARVAAFRQGMQERGWSEGRNLQIEYCWAGPNTERIASCAAKLVGASPEVILAITSPSVAAMQNATRTIPIIFAGISDPVGQGFVTSLARPGGNVTGFTGNEYSLAEKWIGLLKELAPSITRAAYLFHPEIGSFYSLYLKSLEAAAVPLGVDTAPQPVRSVVDVERALGAVAALPNSGVIVQPDAYTIANRSSIIGLIARHRLPSVYGDHFSAVEGGLASYGTDVPNVFRRSAAYVDRLLMGAKPADLPVQAPTKFELVINLKTAKALGLTIPETLLATADEVIQ